MTEIVAFKDQNYKTIYSSLLREGQKFEDPTFPATASSLRQGSTKSDLEWLRPTEISPRPRLVINGLEGADVMQGERGNPWFVTASAAITLRQHFLSSVLPDLKKQEYGNFFHPGIFRFQFQRMGRIYEVVIDDRLPCKRGRLVYCQSADIDEFWSALLEKAYAKLNGDYDCLQFGRCVDAIASFVRGIPEHWDLSKVQDDADLNDASIQAKIWQLLKSYLGRKAIIILSVQPTGSTKLGDWTPQNLVVGRGYLLSDARQLELKDGDSVMLMKLHNSWNDLEWKGPWCDGSPDWEKLSLKTKEQFNHKFAQDGKFWMAINDVLNKFTHIDICVPVSGSSSWHIRTITDEWNTTIRGQSSKKTAGGSYDYPATYVTNPQYLLQIKSSDSQMVSLCLEQGEVSAACHPEKLYPIGLDVFRVEENRACRLKEPPDEAWFVARIEPQRQPSVFIGTIFRPGAYVLMPCTELPDCQQSFALRALTQQKFEISELTMDVPSQGSCCMFCYWSRAAVTRITITKVIGVGAYLNRRDARVMVRVGCEGSDVIDCDSSYCAADRDDFNSHSIDFKLLLYRYKLKDPIDIDVFYNSSLSVIKRFIGQTRVTDANCHAATDKEASLCDEEGKEIPVKILCNLHISGDITFF